MADEVCLCNAAAAALAPLKASKGSHVFFFFLPNFEIEGLKSK